ncbi:hypothetical protein H8M03_09390 [Sphingomonas sabuli]|uniref:DUF885 domain-containing protein n=1 Tax=Sphingomonas sabuli TaxID=2764186 RepID=A0A7G9L0T2_9SPHN|nr:hypothetical protein [Sphingomonas sabuli]QNM82231.1 hypothetical protein H8M03_09390 [Sphingomonas sabuli]
MVARTLTTLALAFLVGACAIAPPATPVAGPLPVESLDSVARDYAVLQLAIGEKEAGYIDAFYGPEALKTEGKALAAASSLAQLSTRADELSSRIAAMSFLAGSIENRRVAMLLANLTAAKTRLRMLSGEKLSFDDEAEGLFGVRPQLKPASSFDPVLAAVEKLVPGDGPLWKRVDDFQDRFLVANDRLKPVFDAAIAACRARTLQHIALPQGERFDLAFVTGKSWGGYNYYQGDYHSKIEINTDLPTRMSRAVDLGCHEGYPGHHVYSSLLERNLVRGRGWIEFSVFPLYSPQAVIAEGSANYGVRMAFPGADRVAFETSTLYPLAGLPPTGATTFDQLGEAMRTLRGATMSIQRDLLDGRITEAQAVELLQKYGLQSEARARKSVEFARQYRSYVINYGLGEQLVADAVEAEPTIAARWKKFEQIIGEPTLPSDLTPRN